MIVEIKKIHPKASVPEYQTQGSAAVDLQACVDEPFVLEPMQRHITPTGLAMAIPRGYEAQIRPRSGLSSRYGICLANGVATIDADYRGEIGVILINLGTDPFTVEPGMRIAQMIFARCEQAEWNVVDALDETERGEGGYGSTGH